MTIELKQEILDLIESPELHVYLMEHAERLKLRDYVSIIAGAPVGLKRKQGLLYKLRETSDIKQQDMDYLKLCCECMDQAVRYLTMESEKIFLIQLMGYNDDNKSDIMDGPYIMTSFEDMKKAVQEYYWNEPDSTWNTLYWRVELYLDGEHEIKKNEFLSPMYTYIMNKDGEIQYFIHEKLSSNYLKGPLGSMAEWLFHSVCPDLNLPVPYQTGDVLFIDCRPYAPDAFYCRLKEVGDDCCGIQCEYVNPEGEIETGALKHGDYFFNHRKVYQYLSPLYKAKIVSKDELNWDDYLKENKMLARPHKGVFWLIDGKIWAVPFDEQKYEYGISKSGDSYVHRKIWKKIKPQKCRYPYNYYPRGRVEITSKNLCILYMNPNIGEEYINEIMKKFGLESVEKIIYDNSSHYRSYLDIEWKADEKR